MLSLVVEVCKNAGVWYVWTDLRPGGTSDLLINDVVSVSDFLDSIQLGDEHSFGGIPVVRNINDSFSNNHLKKVWYRFLTFSGMNLATIRGTRSGRNSRKTIAEKKMIIQQQPMGSIKKNNASAFLFENFVYGSGQIECPLLPLYRSVLYNGSTSINIDTTGALFTLSLSYWIDSVKRAPVMSMFIERLPFVWMYFQTFLI